jgi:hypothetical protein
MIKFAKFVVSLLSSIGSTLLGAFTLATLWAWFAVSTFPTLPVISVVQALGIGLVVAYLTRHISPADIEAIRDNPDYKTEAHLLSWFKPLFFLTVGYIIHLFY